MGFSVMGITEWAVCRACAISLNCIDIVGTAQHISFGTAPQKLGENRAAECNTPCMQESVSKSFIFILLEILLADNDILKFRGFTKWRPDSLCCSSPALIVRRNNEVWSDKVKSLRRSIFTITRLINNTLGFACSAPLCILSYTHMSVLPQCDRGHFSCRVSHRFHCGGWHAEGWVNL